VPAAEKAHVDWCLALDRWVDEGAPSHGRCSEAATAPLEAGVALARAAPKWHLVLGHEYGDREMHRAARIDVKIATQDGNEHFFRYKFSTPLQNLMSAFCNRNGVALNSVRFLFDGNRVNPNQTPEDLEMLNGDTIDVMLQQMGN